MLPHTESHTQSETFDATNTPSSAHLIEMRKNGERRMGAREKCERDSSFDMQILSGFCVVFRFRQQSILCVKNCWSVAFSCLFDVGCVASFEVDVSVWWILLLMNWLHLIKKLCLLKRKKKNGCLKGKKRLIIMKKKTTTSKCFVAFGIDFSSFSLAFSE